MLTSKNISHRREGRGHKHLRTLSTCNLHVVLVDYSQKEEEALSTTLSETLSERIEIQTIIQKLGCMHVG